MTDTENWVKASENTKPLTLVHLYSGGEKIIIDVKKRIVLLIGTSENLQKQILLLLLFEVCL